METVNLKGIMDDCPDNVKTMIDSLPMNMKPTHVAEFMGICLSSAYKLMQAPGFPVIRMKSVKRVIIPKIQFLQWYFSQCSP